MTTTSQLANGHQRNVRLSGTGGQIDDRIFGNANVLHLALVEPRNKVLFLGFLGIKKNHELAGQSLTYFLEVYLNGLHFGSDFFCIQRMLEKANFND